MGTNWCVLHYWVKLVLRHSVENCSTVVTKVDWLYCCLCASDVGYADAANNECRLASGVSPPKNPPGCHPGLTYRRTKGYDLIIVDYSLLACLFFVAHSLS